MINVKIQISISKIILNSWPINLENAVWLTTEKCENVEEKQHLSQKSDCKYGELSKWTKVNHLCMIKTYRNTPWS